MRIWKKTASPSETKRKPGGVSKLRRRIGLVVCVIVFTILISFQMGRFRVFRVVSDSMMPTIFVGDFLLVDARPLITPRRGDVMAFKNPEDPSDWLCKRVVAGPLDEVRIARGVLFINGQRQDDEPYVMSGYVSFRRRYGPIKLEPGQYFVLGDNRMISYDSRDFGPVHESNFIGRVIWIYWPPGRVGSLRAASAPR